MDENTMNRAIDYVESIFSKAQVSSDELEWLEAHKQEIDTLLISIFDEIDEFGSYAALPTLLAVFSLYHFRLGVEYDPNLLKAATTVLQ